MLVPHRCQDPMAATGASDHLGLQHLLHALAHGEPERLGAGGAVVHAPVPGQATHQASDESAPMPIFSKPLGCLLLQPASSGAPGFGRLQQECIPALSSGKSRTSPVSRTRKAMERTRSWVWVAVLIGSGMLLHL